MLKNASVTGVTGAGSVFDTIVNFLTANPAVPGQDWVIHADYRTLSPPFKFDRVVLRNTGKSNNELIYIGIMATVCPSGQWAGVEAGLVLRVYYHFDNTIVAKVGGNDFFTSFWDTVYGSPSGGSWQWSFMPFKTNESSIEKPPLGLWIYSNKARVVLIINTEERYSNGYIGQYIRFVTPQEVPYPLMCWADSFNGGGSQYNESLYSSYLGYQVVDWSSNASWNDNRRNLLYAQHGNWSFAKSYDDRRHFCCNRVRTPTGWGYDWYQDPTQTTSYGPKTDVSVNYPDGAHDQVLFPVFIRHHTASNSDYITLGQLDGVYWAPNIKNTPLTETQDGKYVIFPDINRTNWYSWMAVGDEL